MKLVLISDTHSLHERMTHPIPECDILVHAGDCTNDMRYSGPENLRNFLGWFERQPAKHKVLVAGNHDWYTQLQPFITRDLIAELAPSVTYLLDSGATIGGFKFWGSPVSPRFLNWAWNRDRGADIRRHWDLIPAGLDVLVTHGPVTVGMLDYAPHSREHVGDQDLYEAVQRAKPKIHVAGHIHYGYGHAIIDHGDCQTDCYNAAICTEAYKPTNKPWVIEL